MSDTPPPAPPAAAPCAAPLAGIQVVEIGTSVAAPYATWVLGQLGASVLKVERPGAGDDARQWGELFPDGRSSIFEALNCGKHSVVVDLHDAGQRERLCGFLLARADVVVQNLRAGRVARFGLDAASLRARKPALVYCNIHAFGARGPLAGRPGYDPLMQAYGGLMSVTGEAGRAPVRVGTSIIDMATGMWCAIGVLAALRRREHTGEGCEVDSSLYETALGWMTYHATGLQASGADPIRRGSGAVGMVPYQAYACADGYLMIAAPNDRLFAALVRTLGCERLLQDLRFASNQQRAAHLEALNAELEPVLATRSRDHWRRRLEAAGVPCAPEQRTSEVLADEQTRALGILQRPPGAALDLMGLPLSFDGRRPPITTTAPALGAHDTLLDDGGSGQNEVN